HLHAIPVAICMHGLIHLEHRELHLFRMLIERPKGRFCEQVQYRAQRVRHNPTIMTIWYDKTAAIAAIGIVNNHAVNIFNTTPLLRTPVPPTITVPTMLEDMTCVVLMGNPR